jgi:hypothetical protein
MIQLSLTIMLLLPVLAWPAASLRGRVFDAETGKFSPCVVTIQVSYESKVGSSPTFKLDFRSNGVFQNALPAGKAVITVRRGFDYVAVRRSVILQPGTTQDLTFTLRRRTPLHKLGWYASDNHVHMIHGEGTTTASFSDVALAARAAGLDLMSLAQNWTVTKDNPAVLMEACRKVSTSDLLLTWNMEAPKNYWRGDVSYCLGHGWTLGMRGYTATGQSAIAELDAMSAHDYERDKIPTPNFDSHALIHALGGMVSYTHPCRWSRGEWGGRGGYPVETDKFISNLAAELPFDTIAGPTYDAIDILMQTSEVEANEQGQRLWYMLLNHGYRIPGTASSDTSFNDPTRSHPGAVRNYTHVTGKLTPQKLAEAMRQGRNFVTSGPLLLVDFGGHQIGDIIQVRRPITLRTFLKAWSSGELSENLRLVEVIRNGKVIRQFRPNAPEFSTEFDIHESGTAWYIVHVLGGSANQIAISDPLYFEGSEYRPPRPAEAHVNLRVRDASTHRPLDGTCEVLQMVGRKAIVRSSITFKNGALTITLPATARLRVTAPGHTPVVKSIFMDYKPLLELTLNLRPEQLTDWRTFERIRTLLGQVFLNVDLR